MRSIRAVVMALVLVPAAVLVALVVAFSPAPMAHAVAAKPGPVLQALMEDIDQVEEKILGLVEAMPAEAYDWRPAEGVRSVSEVLVHMAADNYFIPALSGTPAPEATGIRGDSYQSVQAYEGRTVPREQALAELRDSFRHLDEVMGAADEARLGEPLSVFGRESTHLKLWVLTATHLHEHLGQLIAYARTNGVTPPWSR